MQLKTDMLVDISGCCRCNFKIIIKHKLAGNGCYSCRELCMAYTQTKLYQKNRASITTNATVTVKVLQHDSQLHYAKKQKHQKASEFDKTVYTFVSWGKKDNGYAILKQLSCLTKNRATG